MDGLNGVAYDDDKQVVRLIADKKYFEHEGLFIVINEHEGGAE